MVETRRTSEDGVAKSQTKCLRGNVVKKLLRSLKTSVPIVILVSADAALRENML